MLEEEKQAIKEKHEAGFSSESIKQDMLISKPLVREIKRDLKNEW